MYGLPEAREGGGGGERERERERERFATIIIIIIIHLTDKETHTRKKACCFCAELGTQVTTEWLTRCRRSWRRRWWRGRRPSPRTAAARGRPGRSCRTSAPWAAPDTPCRTSTCGAATAPLPDEARPLAWKTPSTRRLGATPCWKPGTRQATRHSSAHTPPSSTWKRRRSWWCRSACQRGSVSDPWSMWSPAEQECQPLHARHCLGRWFWPRSWGFLSPWSWPQRAEESKCTQRLGGYGWLLHTVTCSTTVHRRARPVPGRGWFSQSVAHRWLPG